ncbi:sigma 54-interacting transcriptional regulator [Metallumcola ferriviriculae]|uniref:HTH-type transcriptional regulatory protein TyrR n=1 Tax=Metallumcola ferriviriculae TaxID=3039180 RepID=A0AAU0USA7_9FIRM|nr:sigma 54-interacting transcriptional regulator [Desulfitibacteraceae bacterium MK1]
MSIIKDIISRYNHILDFSFDEFVISDGEGVLLYANAACERHYGVKVEYLIGKHTSELEREGIYHPAVIPLALKERRKVTIIQDTQIGRKTIVTANPVFDDTGNIELVVVNARDISEVSDLKEKLEQTQQLVKRYSEELNVLRREQIEVEGIIAKSKQMQEIMDLIRKVAPTSSTVMLLGETGVGKDVLARGIHKVSKKKQGPFIRINCGAIPGPLLESELFGYEAGAFSGAKKTGKIGLVELANGGTLFLDEVADLPIDLQVKLLQVIQEREMMRVGGTKHIKVDARIISATNKDIETMVHDNLFREDLFYRLHVIPIRIPPLRQRPEDVFAFIQHFGHRLNTFYNINKQLHPQTIDVLVNHDWPGNVRELENFLERLLLTVDREMITPEELPDNVFRKKVNVPVGQRTLNEILSEVEREVVLRVYKRFGSSYKVARELGISQRTALRKINKYMEEP